MGWFGRGRRGQRGKVVVVGAGLAGLAAARRLAVYGFEVVVLDRNPQPGRACRSIVEDGFVLDLGFHVAPGGSLEEVCDPAEYLPLLRPLGTPLLQGSTGPVDLEEARLFTPHGAPFDEMAEELGGLGDFAAMTLSVHPDRPWAEVLGEDRPALITVYRALSMSVDGSAMFNRTNDIAEGWLGGSGALLAGGMADLVGLLAQGVRVTCGVNVERVTRGSDSWLLDTTSGPVAADFVISPRGADVQHGPLEWSCSWFAAPEAPTQHPGVQFWPLSPQVSIHTCVVSNAAPERAPHGALISATWNGPDIDVRRRLGELYGTDTEAWRLLAQQRFGSAPSALSSREVARGHWELGRAFGHVPSVRLGEELADGLAAKQLGVRAFGPLRREMRRRWQWEQAAMSED